MVGFYFWSMCLLFDTYDIPAIIKEDIRSSSQAKEHNRYKTKKHRK